MELFIDHQLRISVDERDFYTLVAMYLILPLPFQKKLRRKEETNSKQNGEKLLETLMKLLLEQQNSLDLSKLNEGYLCRSCGTLLEKFNRLHQQLSDKIVAFLPHIPLVPPAKHQNDLSECSSDCECSSYIPKYNL